MHEKSGLLPETDTATFKLTHVGHFAGVKVLMFDLIYLLSKAFLAKGALKLLNFKMLGVIMSDLASF